MDFRPMIMLSTLRQSVGRLLGARYAKTGLAVGVAVLLVGTLVAVNPGPRRVGTTAGDVEERSGFGLRENEGSTDVSTVEGSPDISPDPPGAPGSSTAGGGEVTGKTTKAAKRGAAAAKRSTSTASGTTAASSGSASSGSEGSSSGGSPDGGGGGGGSGGGGGGGSGGGDGGSPGGGDAPAPGTAAAPDAYAGPNCTAFKGCANATGISADEIRVGVVYTEQREACGGSGQFPICFGDPKKQGLAMQDDINRRGGINGRKVKVVFFPDPDIPITPTQNMTEAEAQQLICRGFVDRKVFAVLTHWAGQTLAQCLADNRILALRTGSLIGDDQVLARTSPWVWTPPDKSNDRFWKVLLPALSAQGYLNPGDKVGLVVQEGPAYDTAYRFVVDQLRKTYGITDIDEYRYRVSGGGAMFDFAALNQAGNRAAQQFRDSDRKKVMFIPSFLVFPAFMAAAEGDGDDTKAYRPRYALDSTMVLNGPVEHGAPQKGSVKTKQLRDATGIGWRRLSDMSGMGAGPYTPREIACKAAMERGGETIKDRTNPVLAMQHCEVFYAFEEAAKRAGRDLTSGTFVRGLTAIGPWDSLVSYGVDFARGRTDASLGHRWIRYACGDAQCSYTSSRMEYYSGDQGAVRGD